MKKKLKGWFAHTRQRGVLKVATAYIAFGWLTLSVCNTLFNLFKLPTAGPQIIFLLFALGFPVAVLGAWKGWFGKRFVAQVSGATAVATDPAATADTTEKGAQGGLWPAMVFTIGTVLAFASAPIVLLQG